VGNPPWINWEHLPEFYRNETKQLWDNYDLLKRTKGMGLGKVKRDMAMLFVARCLDRFTKDGGKFSFLVPFTVYKTQAGAGFRKFLSRGYWRSEKENSPCKVLKIHDLVTLYPFEGAINRTSLIVIEKSGKTEFPISCIMWHNPKSKGIDQEVEIEEVKKTTKQFDMILTPIKKGDPETPWMIVSEKAYAVLSKIMRPSEYEAHAGVYTGADAVFWINVISKQPSGFLVTNVGETAKMRIKRVKKLVEPNFIFPVIRGRNHKKWFVKSEGYILLPLKPNGEILSEAELKVNYPKTYSFFLEFLEELKNRAAYRQLFGKSNKPTYSVLNSKNAIMPYKVAWKHIAGKITGKALFECAVIHEERGKPIIPTHGIIYIPCMSENEAYFVCGILNSSFSSLIIASYALEVHLTTDIPKNVYIPKFNPKDKLHLKLSELSKKAHDLAKRYYEEKDLTAQEELKKIEEEIDKTVAELYGVTEGELEEIRRCLLILKEGEILEEESEEEEITLPREEGIKILVEPLLVNENVSKELNIKVSNYLSEILENGQIKVMLRDKILTDQKVERVEKEEEKLLKFTLPKLKAGRYDLRINFSFKIAGQMKNIEESRTLFVKPISKKIAKINIEELNEFFR
jgi:hypothetical protein